jgi:hypothetical protein
MKMCSHRRICVIFSPETLDSRVSPTLLSAGAAMAVPEVSAFIEAGDDDPLPDPEPAPGPYPGDNPPIDHPELPPSGPVGPGSSRGHL